jgi:cyclic dehypoxanthinyl futalosine synthase
MSFRAIFDKALAQDFLTLEEGLSLYHNAPLSELIFVAHELRKINVPGDTVTWQIDRNVNITNVCISGCKFCNFHCGVKDSEAFITTLPDYMVKVDEMLRQGGDQLLLQGGLHPKLGLDFYTNLFKEIKKEYPLVKLHALGPPEIAHIARIEKMEYRDVLLQLIDAGLNSLPGAGAEILVDRARQEISPGKPNAQAWLDVMAEAHKLGLLTTATMMFGHVETQAERMEHLIKIRDLQTKKPLRAVGFSAFICWPFQDKNTTLSRQGVLNSVTPDDYIRTIAISRIMLPNIKHIQASWLTVGIDTAQLCLYAGADDFGSIMIEENVVSSAGATHVMDAYGIQKAIADAGFEPQLRNQAYENVFLNDSEFSRFIFEESSRNKEE